MATLCVHMFICQCQIRRNYNPQVDDVFFFFVCFFYLNYSYAFKLLLKIHHYASRFTQSFRHCTPHNNAHVFQSNNSSVLWQFVCVFARRSHHHKSAMQLPGVFPGEAISVSLFFPAFKPVCYCSIHCVFIIVTRTAITAINTINHATLLIGLEFTLTQNQT